MSDYISRQAVDDAIYDYSRSCDVNYGQLSEHVDSIPSADVRENIHGVWIHYNDEFYSPDRLTPVLRHIFECSVCHHKIADFHGLMNFCTNCGADMRGGEE